MPQQSLAKPPLQNVGSKDCKSGFCNGSVPDIHRRKAQNAENMQSSLSDGLFSLSCSPGSHGGRTLGQSVELVYATAERMHILFGSRSIIARGAEAITKLIVG